MNEELIAYIKRHIELGYHPDKIKQVLIRAGWEPKVVEEHISHVLGLKSRKHPLRNIKQSLGSNSERYFIFALIIILVIIVLVTSFNYFSGLFKKTEVESKELVIVSGQNESLELLNKALIRNDEAICDKIGNDKLRIECKNKFLFNKSCDEQCQNANMLNKAVISNNISLCSDIANETLRENCLNVFNRTFAYNETAEDACDEACMDKEFLNLALISNNATICSKINNTLIKNQCENMFVKR